MAKVIPATPFESLSGKLSANERIVMRVRNGKMHAYAIQNPYKGVLLLKVANKLFLLSPKPLSKPKSRWPIPTAWLIGSSSMPNIVPK